jgi:acetyl esterase/lipase
MAQAILIDQAFGHSAFGYVISEEVPYDHSLVARNGKEVERNLWMDVYQPDGEASAPRPAVIMTFGGAFHRGIPRTTTESGGATDTSMADYCRVFAASGYICFAIDYRLTTEEPVLTGAGFDQDTINPENLLTLLPQINHIRSSVLGIDAIDFDVPEQRATLVNGVIGAAEDLGKAVDFIRSSSTKFNIDPDRIVLGGFSAGAVTSWNVAHGMGAPVAGVFLLSGANSGFDIKKL